MGRIFAWVRRQIVCRHPATADDDGFTLLEVLVALGILGLSLSVLLGVFSMALNRTRANQSKTAAEHLAEALLLQAETADPAKLTDSHGTAATGLVWAIKTSPYGSADDRNGWQNAPAKIIVNVQWQDQGRARVLTLSTLKIVPGSGHD